MVNTTGKMFQITTFGSSHGLALGAVVDGCPANLELNEKDICIVDFVAVLCVVLC